MLAIRGLVIRERPIGENDKILSILSDSTGVIEVCARGVRKANAKYASVSQQFCYADYTITQGKSFYILISAEPIRTFYEVRLDISKFALASYFCEVLMYVCVGDPFDRDIIRLTLNTLHFLCKTNISEELLKNIFDLRLLTDIGFMPNLIGCCECYTVFPPVVQFDFSSGNLYCEHCSIDLDPSCSEIIDSTILHYIRSVALCDMSKIFSVRVAKERMPEFTRVIERFFNYKIDKHFPTLDFYRSLHNNDNNGTII